MEEGDVQFWLPPDFLDDGDGLFLGKGDKFPSTSTSSRRGLGVLDFPGSNPEESDEEEDDDLVAGVTVQMNPTFRQGDTGENRKERTVSGSPQSILCVDLGVWSDCSKGSHSTDSTPPSTPLEQSKDDALDLLSAAAGQVSRLHGRGILGVPAASPVTVGFNYNSRGATGFYSNLAVPQQQMPPMQGQRWNQQEYPSAWGRQPSRGYNGAVGVSDWPPLQRQLQPPLPGSGMRAVFLVGKGTTNGTGVFLPRRPGNPAEMRRKPACSVLLPDRVIQALNLNLEEMSTHGLPRITSPPAKQTRERHRPSPSVTAPCHEPLQLPAEWTY